ncbi:hypothetical protein [Marinitoga lauensis]|nr:hypothetical protein [Marinitoga lauensis]
MLINIGVFNENIVGNSLFGGLYIYSLKDKTTKVILKDVPLLILHIIQK